MVSMEQLEKMKDIVRTPPDTRRWPEDLHVSSCEAGEAKDGEGEGFEEIDHLFRLGGG